MRSALLLPLVAGLSFSLNVSAQSLYFPPNGSSAWDTLSPASLGWCPDRIDSLIDFVGSRNTKAFLILKDGRIVIEHYYGAFTQDSLWYWASAGKTLASMLTGIAQEEGFLDINDATSQYLGTGWTSATPGQEAQITVLNQLTMTSGLDDGVADVDCTLPSCLEYLADPGDRWAYHNAPYTLLDQVISGATGTTFSSYFNTRIRNPIGMEGFWFPSGYNNVYGSKARSMARFGLLVLNEGVWNADTILNDAAYFTAMTTPSQSLNESYGYLWWLNGQSSFMVPGLQFVFPGMIMPDAPADMISALGKNDQLLNVVPSQGLVVVRMGNPADSTLLVPISFNNQVWQLINALPCSTAVDEASFQADQVVAYPQPCEDRVDLRGVNDILRIEAVAADGRVFHPAWDGTTVFVNGLPPGVHMLRVSSTEGERTMRIVKR
ncbi:MAG: serine hydrolase [Flavobacteriales bacterium]|nr:serine hydrolase [Flavobacteriales bacterium]MBK9537771.1 serine hydrolase [Flavobacteriales bacterium]